MVDTATVLESLSETDWSRVEHAYGPATDVPDLLRAVVSTDAETRGNAMWELYGNIIHQNTRFSATPKVVPYLLNLAAASNVPDRATLLSYLTNLIAGPYTVRDGFWICDGQRTVAYDDEQAEIALACYQAALPGIPSLIQLATGPFAAVRTAAVSVLGCFRTERDQLLPVLRARAEVETVASVRAAIAFSTALLTEGTPVFEAAVRPFHEQDVSSLVRVTAAIMLGLYGFGDGGVVQTLIDGLSSIALQTRYRQLPWGHEHMFGDIGHALASVRPELGARAVPAIGAALREVDLRADRDKMSMVQVIGLVKALNALAFPYGGNAAAFTPLQREAITWLVRARTPWVVGNVIDAFEEMGIAADREKSAALVGVSLAKAEQSPVQDPVDQALRQDTDEAVLDALLALPEDEYVLSNRGYALLRLERLDEAVELLQSATDRFPDFGPCWSNLALAYYRQSRYTDAVNAMDNAIICDSDDADNFYNRAGFRMLAGDSDGAIADVQEMVDRSPELLPELENDEDFAALVTDPRWEAVRAMASTAGGA